MYESPINITELTRGLQEQVQQDRDRKIIESIWECGIEVNKEELIKALKYDRDQYTKGYNDALDKIRAEVEDHCGLARENHCRYCPYCNNLMGIREILEIMRALGTNEKKTNKLKENVDDFKIGDIVYAPGYSHSVVVIVVDDTQVRVMNHLGDNSWVSKCEVKKTGDYLAQVAHVFSLIKGAADK